jgi:hypothetical protein
LTDDSDVDDCDDEILELELFALLSLVLEIDEYDGDDDDDSLWLLLDELDELDEDDKDDPPLLLSLDDDDEPSGMSVHVAHICTVNARRRILLPSAVSAVVLGPVSFAPWTVKPATVLR